MKIFESLRIAMRALAANKLRSILTMLGIIIGVGAVIALMSIGRGVEKYVTDQFAGLGSNLLFITPGRITEGPPHLRQGQLKVLLSAISAPSGEWSGARGERRGWRLPDLGQWSATVRDDRQVNATTPISPTCATGRPPLASISPRLISTSGSVWCSLARRSTRSCSPARNFRSTRRSHQRPELPRHRRDGEQGRRRPGGSQDRSVFLPLTTAQDRLFKQKTVSGEYALNVIYASIYRRGARGRGPGAD